MENNELSRESLLHVTKIFREAGDETAPTKEDEEKGPNKSDDTSLVYSPKDSVKDGLGAKLAKGIKTVGKFIIDLLRKAIAPLVGVASWIKSKIDNVPGKVKAITDALEEIDKEISGNKEKVQSMQPRWKAFKNSIESLPSKIGNGFSRAKVKNNSSIRRKFLELARNFEDPRSKSIIQIADTLEVAVGDEIVVSGAILETPELMSETMAILNGLKEMYSMGKSNVTKRANRVKQRIDNALDKFKMIKDHSDQSATYQIIPIHVIDKILAKIKVGYEKFTTAIDGAKTWFTSKVDSEMEEGSKKEFSDALNSFTGFAKNLVELSKNAAKESKEAFADRLTATKSILASIRSFRSGSGASTRITTRSNEDSSDKESDTKEEEKKAS
jgi:hypothetical protein